MIQGFTGRHNSLQKCSAKIYHRALYQALRTALTDPPLGTLASANKLHWGKNHLWGYNKDTDFKTRNLAAVELIAGIAQTV